MGVQIVYYTSTHQQFEKKNAFLCLQIHNTPIHLDEAIPKYIHDTNTNYMQQ